MLKYLLNKIRIKYNYAHLAQWQRVRLLISRFRVQVPSWVLHNTMYFAPFFNNGTPIEDSWMNRSNATDFSNLTDYNSIYSQNAGRYNVGEFGNFITLPMMNVGMNQIHEWGIENIKKYFE